MDGPGASLKPIDKSLLDEAYSLVTGDRQKAYDHPARNFERIAKLWSPIFGVEVTPAQVALAMIQVKVAREIHAPKKDNRIDLIGYCLTLEAVR
jgi:hypothetical protein